MVDLKTIKPGEEQYEPTRIGCCGSGIYYAYMEEDGATFTCTCMNLEDCRTSHRLWREEYWEGGKKAKETK